MGQLSRLELAASVPDEVVQFVKRREVRLESKVGVAVRFARRRERHVELRGGTVLVSTVSGEWGEADVIALPVESLVVERKGRSTLLLDAGNGNLNLRFSSHVERESWAYTIEQEKIAAESVSLDNFEVLRPIGRGGMGRVLLVQDRSTKERLAMKVLARRNAARAIHQLRHALEERSLLETLDHPFILKLRYALQTEHNLYMLTEYCEGGDALSLLRSLPARRLDEQLVRTVLVELVLALEHMHAQGAIYRDLKPENVLFDARGHVRLADFGLSRRLNHGQRAYSFVGTPLFMAPEIHSRSGYEHSADLWSLGVLAFTLLEGYPPFESGVTNDLAMREKRAPSGPHVSSSAVELIDALLKTVPQNRPTFASIKAMPFFEGVCWERAVEQAAVTTTSAAPATVAANIAAAAEGSSSLVKENPATSVDDDTTSLGSLESAGPLYRKRSGWRRRNSKRSRDFIPGYSFNSLETTSVLSD